MAIVNVLCYEAIPEVEGQMLITVIADNRPVPTIGADGRRIGFRTWNWGFGLTAHDR